MNLFKRFSKPPVYDTDYFTDIAFTQHRTEIDTLLALVQPYDRALVKDALRRLLIYAWDLPGDWGVFTNTPGMPTDCWGVFAKTLELATSAVAQYQHAKLQHWDHATLVIAAGLWASREMPLYIVHASDLVTKTEHAWIRGDTVFLHWIIALGGGGELPGYRITMTQGLAAQVELAAQAAWFLSAPIERIIGYENVLRLWEFALAPEPRTKMHGLLGVARQDELCSKFLEALSNAVTDSMGTLKVNTIPGHVFVLDDETFVVHPVAVKAVMGEAHSPDDVLSSLINEGSAEALVQARITPTWRSPVTLTGFFINTSRWERGELGRFDGEVERVS